MRMRRANLSRFTLFKTTKKFSLDFYRNENQFFARYTLIFLELESYSNRPEIINVLPLNSKILGGLLLRFFFVLYVWSGRLPLLNFASFCLS